MNSAAFAPKFTAAIFRSLPAIGLYCLCCLSLTACAPYGGGGDGQTLPTQREHDTFKAMILSQAEFTEPELLKFMEIIPGAGDLQPEAAMDYLAANGWEEDRAQYLILKLGMAVESQWAKQSYASLFPAIPPVLYPSLKETGLVRKYYDRLVPFFLPKDIAAPGVQAQE